MSAFFGRLRDLDAYTKPMEDFRVRTLTGGAVTLISAVLIGLLFAGELMDFLETETTEELFVDSSRTSNSNTKTDRVNINFDIVFPRMACDFLSIDAMDVSGEQQADVHQNIWKQKLDAAGKPVEDQQPEKHEVGGTAKTSTSKPAEVKCGSCYGAETKPDQCCQTCDDVKFAYRRKGWAVDDISHIEQCKGEKWVSTLVNAGNQGCRVYGSLAVAKVAGNVHMSPGEVLKDAHQHVHDLHSLNPSKFNTTHTITHLSFGESYPNKLYPLDKTVSLADAGGMMFSYYVKIVPTTFRKLDTVSHVSAHQFSVTRHEKRIDLQAGSGLPGVFFIYEFSPLMVRLTEKRKSFTHFLTSVCAIIGGVYTVASIIDAFLYHSARKLKQKIEIGKAI